MRTEVDGRERRQEWQEWQEAKVKQTGLGYGMTPCPSPADAKVDDSPESSPTTRQKSGFSVLKVPEDGANHAED
jgi:hypothetical protein